MHEVFKFCFKCLVNIAKQGSLTIDINLTGTFLTIKYAVPHLKQQGGSIIVTASVKEATPDVVTFAAAM